MKPNFYTCILLVLLSIGWSLPSNAQQKFRFRYIFSSEKFSSPNLKLVGKRLSPTPTRTNVGTFTQPGSTSAITIYKVKADSEATYTPKNINGSLSGRITKRNEDTLFIKFWYIKDRTNIGSASIVNINDNKKKFIYVIDSTQWSGRYPHFKIPFRYTMATATSLPFRVMFNKKGIESDFLNFNLALFEVYGRTKFYKESFIEPRNKSWGYGGFVGLSTIKEKEPEINRFGLNAGITGLYSFYNLNIVVGLGVEQGFTRKTNTPSAYVGFGFGFKLVDLSDPEIKTE